MDLDQPAPEKPGTFMEAEEAELLRKYQVWLETNEYERYLWCTRCRERVEVHVTQGDIGLICSCRVTLHKVS